MKKLFATVFLMLSVLDSFASDKTRTVLTHSKVGEKDHPETVVTVDGIEGYVPTRNPETDKYGGWKIANLRATGFFRVEKYDGRWWIVTPEGHPFICRGVATFTQGSSNGKYFKERYSSSREWGVEAITLLKENGFNCAGAWSNTRLLVKMDEKIPYCVYVGPMKTYMKAHHKGINSQKYALVFDGELPDAVRESVKSVSLYKDDPWCMGVFIDNEIPWGNDLLEFYLNELPSDDPNHIEAVKWMRGRKGRRNAPVSLQDRELFAVHAFEHYQKIAVEALREVDPNHMYLGCRFHSWRTVLCNDHLIKKAGSYFDIISLNHYGKWTPSPKLFDRWADLSGKPLMVTEFYTKGEDSGMANGSGAGWIVPTQRDRGLFYQNFTRCLLQSSGCVGWQWFQYRDNDPANTKADASNRNSNKGIVDYRFNAYDSLLEEMKCLNDNSYGILRHYQAHPLVRGAGVLITGIGKDADMDERFRKLAYDLDLKCTFSYDPSTLDLSDESWKIIKEKLQSLRRDGHSFVMTLGCGDEQMKENYDKFSSLMGYFASPMNETVMNPVDGVYTRDQLTSIGSRYKYVIGGKSPKNLRDGPSVIEPLRLSIEGRDGETCRDLVRNAFEHNVFIVIEIPIADALSLGGEFFTYLKEMAVIQPLNISLASWINR